MFNAQEAADVAHALRDQAAHYPGFIAVAQAADLLDAASRELATYKTLAGIGAWHKDCRPNRQMAAREIEKSQAVINKLADTISALTKRAEIAENTARVGIEADNHHNALACPYCTENLAELFDGKVGELQAEIKRLDALLHRWAEHHLALMDLERVSRRSEKPAWRGKLVRGQGR